MPTDQPEPPKDAAATTELPVAATHALPTAERAAGAHPLGEHPPPPTAPQAPAMALWQKLFANYGPRVWREFGYILSALLLVLIFVAATWLLAIMVAMYLPLGVLALPLVLMVGSFFARIIRNHNTLWTKTPALHPTYLSSRPNQPWYLRLLYILIDAQRWIDWIAAVFAVITATIAAIVTALWLTLGIGGVIFAIWRYSIIRSLDDPAGDFFYPEVRAYLEQPHFGWQLALISMLVLALAPLVIRLVGHVHFLITDYLVSGQQHWMDQMRRNERLQKTAGAARDAETLTFAALERNIHDGPQQQLVRLGIDLSRARMQLKTNPNVTDELLGQSIARTTTILDELRSIARGIAPPVLLDKGLQAAIEELCARNTTPTTLNNDLGDQPLPEVIQQTVYFVISEALTNVAKHAEATTCTVTTSRQENGPTDWLHVLIIDDGTGGAASNPGSGLEGMGKRLNAIEGHLTVTSPQGGPTVVSAMLPIPAEQ